MKRKFWTSADDAMLRKLYADTSTQEIAKRFGRSISGVYGRASLLGLKKSAEFMRTNLSALGTAMARSEAGIKHRFPKGHVPANKGLRRPGWARGRMAETQFKKGRRPEEARNYRPIGSTRIVYGNLERKVTDDPAIYPAKRWRPVHKLVWEAANGPVPPGYIAVFKQDLHTIVEEEITLDRVEVISYAENMRRNTIHNLPQEIKDAVRSVAVLNRRIHRVEKHNGSARGDVRRAGQAEEGRDRREPGQGRGRAGPDDHQLGKG